MRFLPPNLTAPAWGFGSAAPSLNRMAAACGPPTTLRAAQVFTLLYLPKSGRVNDARIAPTAFVIDDAAAVEFLSAESSPYLTGQTLLIDGESSPARPTPWLRPVVDKPPESS